MRLYQRFMRPLISREGVNWFEVSVLSVAIVVGGTGLAIAGDAFNPNRSITSLDVIQAYQTPPCVMHEFASDNPIPTPNFVVAEADSGHAAQGHQTANSGFDAYGSEVHKEGGLYPASSGVVHSGMNDPNQVAADPAGNYAGSGHPGSGGDPAGGGGGAMSGPGGNGPSLSGGR